MVTSRSKCVAHLENKSDKSNNGIWKTNDDLECSLNSK